MDIREGRPLRYGNDGNSRIIASWQELQDGSDVRKIDQYIVGRNSTRMHINWQECRSSLTGPLPGDKLVCLRNNHTKGLLNGEQFTLHQIDKTSEDGFMTLYVKSDDRAKPDYVKTHRLFFKCKDVEDARARVGEEWN